jgi:hypothetical protein
VLQPLPLYEQFGLDAATLPRRRVQLKQVLRERHDILITNSNAQLGKILYQIFRPCRRGTVM